MAKIKTKGTQTFNVPNTEEGRLFLSLARKFRNKGVRIVPLGRAKDRYAAYAKLPPYVVVRGTKTLIINRNTKPNRQRGVPQSVSDWMAVYIKRTGVRRRSAAPVRPVSVLSTPMSGLALGRGGPYGYG